MTMVDLLGCRYNREGETPEDGFNCYSLARYVRRNFYGLDTPVVAMEGFSPEWAEKAFRDNTTPDWQITSSPAAGDLVVMRLPVRKSWHHCGILIESGQVLHAYEGPNSVGRIIAQKPAALLRLFAEVAYAKWLH